MEYCDDCLNLTPTEREQDEQEFKTRHWCRRLKTHLIHYHYHPNLPRPKRCDDYKPRPKEEFKLKYPMEDWIAEVTNKSTVLGLKEWRQHMEERRVMKTKVWFVGIDGCNRPIFKDKYGSCFGSLDKLFSHFAPENLILSEVIENDLTYFGNKFGCEPMGTEVEGLLIVKRRYEDGR